MGAYIVSSGKPDVSEHRHYIARQEGPVLDDRGRDVYRCRCNCGHFWTGVGRTIDEAYDASLAGFNEHTARVAGRILRHRNVGIPETPLWIGKYSITSYPIRSSKVTGNWNRT